MLFEAGERPSLAQLRSAITRISNVSISHDPSTDDGDSSWVELLHDGLTFDLSGLAPGGAMELPKVKHRIDLPSGEVLGGFEGIALAPGPHLSGGESALPIVRGWLELAHILCDSLRSVVGIIWGPGRIAIGAEPFARLAAGWTGGGPFPAIALIGFENGDAGFFRSDGLAFFTGQELEIGKDVVHDSSDATRLAVRLINELVVLGTIEQVEQFTAPDGGPLSIMPSDDRNVLYIRRG